MPDGTCKVDGCDRPVVSREWCRRHYSRWWMYGDPLGTRRGVDIQLQARTDRSGGLDACWPWTGALQPSGYARIMVKGLSRGAHVYAWENAHGREVPTGWHIDHECHNQAVRDGSCQPGICPHRRCCNPAHLVARTPQDHIAATGTRKLSDDQVRSIKAALAAGETGTSVANAFGVSFQLISFIKTGRRYGHIA